MRTQQDPAILALEAKKIPPVQKDDIDNKFSKKAPEEYRQGAKKQPELKNDQEFFLYRSRSKRETPKIYYGSHCISGLQTDAIISMIDICHIVLFNQSYDDTITYIKPMHPNSNKVFYLGFSAIDKGWKVIASTLFKENDIYDSSQTFTGMSIQLPIQEQHFPLK